MRACAKTVSKAPSMKTDLSRLSRAYLRALRQYLRSGAQASSEAAQKLGRRAAAMKLATLDLAHLHDDCLHALVSPDQPPRASDPKIRRARAFFAEALTPIEESHRNVRNANDGFKETIRTLTRRTSQLAVANDKLQREVSRRREVENSLRNSEAASRRLLERSRHMQEELRLLSRRLITVQEDERKAISRELHDVIGQTLAGVNLRLSTLKVQTTASTRELQRKIAATQRLVEKSVAIVHRFASDLRPAVLDDLGLIPAMESFLAGFTAETGLPVELSASSAVEKRDGAVRTVLYRVMQEALANVARHAQATRAWVRIVNRRGTLRMEITDNGKGFEADSTFLVRASTRLGLLGMRERVEMIGGTFSLESTPGVATTIRVDIPPRGKKDGPRPPRAS